MNIPPINGYQMCTSPSCAYNRGASAKKPPSDVEMIQKQKSNGDLAQQDKFVKQSKKTEIDTNDMRRKMGAMFSAGGGTN